MTSSWLSFLEYFASWHILTMSFGWIFSIVSLGKFWLCEKLPSLILIYSFLVIGLSIPYDWVPITSLSFPLSSGRTLLFTSPCKWILNLVQVSPASRAIFVLSRKLSCIF